MDKLSYALGLGIGRQLSQMGADDLNVADFAQAVKDMIDGKEPQVPTAEAQQIVEDFFRRQEEKQCAEAAEKYKGAKSEGEKYLSENAKKEGVVTLPSGLQYKVFKEGNGKSPRLPTRWCAITRVCWLMERCSTVLFSAASLPLSP